MKTEFKPEALERIRKREVSKRPADILMFQHLKELFPSSSYSIASEFAFHGKRKWRFDYAVRLYQSSGSVALHEMREIAEFKIANEGPGIGIEIEGGIWTNGGHTRGKGYQEDLDKYNSATAAGWRVFRFSVQDVLTGKDLEYLRQWLANRQEAA